MKYSKEQVNRAVNIINNNNITVLLFGEEIEVNRPNFDSTIEALKYLALLPNMEVKENDPQLLGRLVLIGGQLRPLLYAVALLVYGVKDCKKKRFILFGQSNLEKYVKKLGEESTVTEMKQVITTLFSSNFYEDFFALAAALMSIMIIPTETTA